MRPEMSIRFARLAEDRLLCQRIGVCIVHVYRQRAEFQQGFAQDVSGLRIGIHGQREPAHYLPLTRFASWFSR